MGRLSLSTIQAELARDQWTLVSENYKNLDTNLEYRCSEGHVVIAPWRQIRVERVCPTCMRARLKKASEKIKKKRKDDFRILALDQSTRTSGYAIYNNRELIDYGAFVAQGETDIKRDVQVKQWMLSLIDRYEIDLVGLEGIQYEQKIGVTVFESLARLGGVLMVACEEEDIAYNIVPTNTWRAHCGVKGLTRSEKKASMQAIVKSWYGLMPSDDECDAIGIGRYYSDTHAPKVEIIDWENG